MACGDEMAARLSRYVDGELPPEERASVDEHLTGCEPCRDLLALFQKNENLLSGALSTESFGNAVIESVMRSIRGEEAPPEARPVEPNLWERLRERPLIPFAAAAVFVAGVAVFLTVSHSRREAELRGLAARAAEESRAAREGWTAQREAYEKTIQDLAVRWVSRDAAEFAAFGYMGPNHYLVVRANFDQNAFKKYDVFRRDETQGEDACVQLNAEKLQEPVYTDTTARGGKGYVYKFRAWREDGRFAESAPILMRALLIPEGSMKINCIKIAAPKDKAVFEIEKTVNGNPVREEFIVGLNQPVGGVRDVPGAGPMDFSTGYLLSRIEDGMQWIEVTYTAPMTDENGRPIIERIGKGSMVPAEMTVRHTTPMAPRENRRAILRPAAGTSTDRDEAIIWQGGRMWVRVR